MEEQYAAWRLLLVLLPSRSHAAVGRHHIFQPVQISRCGCASHSGMMLRCSQKCSMGLSQDGRQAIPSSPLPNSETALWGQTLSSWRITYCGDTGMPPVAESHLDMRSPPMMTSLVFPLRETPPLKAVTLSAQQSATPLHSLTLQSNCELAG